MKHIKNKILRFHKYVDHDYKYDANLAYPFNLYEFDRKLMRYLCETRGPMVDINVRDFIFEKVKDEINKK